MTLLSNCSDALTFGAQAVEMAYQNVYYKQNDDVDTTDNNGEKNILLPNIALPQTQ